MAMFVWSPAQHAVAHAAHQLQTMVEDVSEPEDATEVEGPRISEDVREPLLPSDVPGNTMFNIGSFEGIPSHSAGTNVEATTSMKTEAKLEFEADTEFEAFYRRLFGNKPLPDRRRWGPSMLVFQL